MNKHKNPLIKSWKAQIILTNEYKYVAKKLDIQLFDIWAYSRNFSAWTASDISYYCTHIKATFWKENFRYFWIHKHTSKVLISRVWKRATSFIMKSFKLSFHVAKKTKSSHECVCVMWSNYKQDVKNWFSIFEATEFSSKWVTMVNNWEKGWQISA